MASYYGTPAAAAVAASNSNGKYVTFFTDNISSIEVPRAGRRDEFLDFNARCVSFMEKEIPEKTVEYDLWCQQTKKSIELQKVRKCTSGIGEQCVSAECRLSLKCMQMVKQKLLLADGMLKESIDKAYDVITQQGTRKLKPSEVMRALEQIIGRTDGIIVGQGFPLTPEEVTQNKRMFDSISKNKHHQVGGLLFPIQLSNFLNQRSKRTEEDRVTIVTSKSEYYGLTTIPVTRWFGLSCVIERIDVENKKTTKENGQVLLSTHETNALIKWFLKPSENVKTYFSLTLGYTDPMDEGGNGGAQSSEAGDDNLSGEGNSQINFSLGDSTLKALMMHNKFMKTNLYRSNNLAITEADLVESDDITETMVTPAPRPRPNILAKDTPKRLKGLTVKKKQLAAATKTQKRKKALLPSQQHTIPETDVEDGADADGASQQQQEQPLQGSRKRKRPVAVVESDLEDENDDDDDDDEGESAPPPRKSSASMSSSSQQQDIGRDDEWSE